MLVKLGALLPYRRARAVLVDFFPIGDAPAIDTIHQRTLQVGARLEHEAIAVPPPIPTSAAVAIELSIDSGHVRALRSYQARSFEVFVARISNDDRNQITFSSVPAEADQQTQQLRGVLQGLGATSTTETTILSDGADGPRSLAEAACVGPTYHVLVWFHLAMRIHHVAQAVKGWPQMTVEDRGEGARLADAVEHIRWRLWHGKVDRALDFIGGTLGQLGDTATASTPAAAAAGKVSAVLRGLEMWLGRPT